MAVLHHNHAHIFQNDGRSRPSETFCIVQFVAFWIAFFGLAYVVGLLIQLVVS